MLMKKRYLILSLLVALGMITFLDRICMSVAGSRIIDDLDFSTEQWGWIQGAFILSYGLFQIPLGILADRWGPRAVLVGIVLWWSLFTGLTGLVSGFMVMLGVRFMFGIGEAGAYPGMSCTVARWFPTGQRAMSQGFIWAASRLGGALAPLMVVPVQKVYGWRASFFLLGLIGLAWGMIWYLFARNSPAEQPGIRGSELDEISEGKKPIQKTAAPWGRIVRTKQFWLILSMYWFYVWGSWFYFSWLHTFLVKGRGFSEEQMGLYSALPFVLGTFSNVAGGYLSDWAAKKIGLRLGRRIIGTVCLALSAILLAGAGLSGDKVSVVLLLSLSFGVMDLMLPSAWAVCLDVGHKYAGAISGAMNTAGNLGGFLCTVLFGYIVKMSNNNYNVPLFVIATMLMISSLLFSRIDSSHPLAAEDVKTE